MENPAVVGARIQLGNCFDLLDPPNVNFLKMMKEQLVKGLKESEIKVPTNYRQHRNLDCAVFNFVYSRAIEDSEPFDSARAVYVPTSKKKRVWPTSLIYHDAHIQVCIRNSENIVDIWREKESNL